VKANESLIHLSAGFSFITITHNLVEFSCEFTFFFLSLSLFFFFSAKSFPQLFISVWNEPELTDQVFYSLSLLLEKLG
jgi:hypothetical protein